MQAVCVVACAALESEAASVALVDREADELVFVAASGQAHDLVGGRFRATEGGASRALTGGVLSGLRLAAEPNGIRLGATADRKR
jgi:hypothetical protein